MAEENQLEQLSQPLKCIVINKENAEAHPLTPAAKELFKFANFTSMLISGGENITQHKARLFNVGFDIHDLLVPAETI